MSKYLLPVNKLYIFFLSILFVKYIKIEKIDKEDYLKDSDFYLPILNKNFPQDNITLVSALYNISSKHSLNDYLIWTKNLLKINCSIIFFTQKSILSKIKKEKPEIFINKTIWIELEIENFISSKYFLNEFRESYKIDLEKNIHSVPLYLVWAEKCFFIKRAIINNYFNSSCFYWIDAGYFRKRNDSLYINGWPSSKRCYEDPRVIINSIRLIKKTEIKRFLTLNYRIFNNFIKKDNVGGGLFGGNVNYLIKFVDLYFKTIKIFIKKKLFIGKDQNLFAYISFSNENVVKVIYSGNWRFFKSYLS